MRDQLGIAMDGPDDLAEYHRVEFRAPLAQVAGERRYGLYVITCPAAAGVLARRGRGDRWGFSQERTPGRPRFVDYRDEQLAELIAVASGVAGIRPRIERCSALSFAAQIAERYRDRRGFVVGDAAYRMTRRGGTGMNTAIQDGFDLGWKLAWVLQGWADPDLLASYESDRRPVGLHKAGRPAIETVPGATPKTACGGISNGCLAHHWVERGIATISTLDLLGDGLTLLAGPDEPRWAGATTTLDARAPVSVHLLDEATSGQLGLEPTGALLLRPDGQQLRKMASLRRISRPRAARRSASSIDVRSRLSQRFTEQSPAIVKGKQTRQGSPSPSARTEPAPSPATPPSWPGRESEPAVSGYGSGPSNWATVLPSLLVVTDTNSHPVPFTHDEEADITADSVRVWRSSLTDADVSGTTTITTSAAITKTAFRRLRARLSGEPNWGVMRWTP